MFEENEWSQLVAKLASLTHAGRIEWTEGDMIYKTSVGDILYVIGTVDNDGRPPYFVGVWDSSESRYLARLESEPFPDAMGTPPQTAAEAIPALYALAARSAAGAPQLFNELIGALNDLDDVDDVPF